MDSGCTNHMTGDKELFIDDNLSHSSQKYITFGDNNKGKVIGLGKVAISKDKHIDKVMLVQSLGYNLMSISKLCDMGMLVLFLLLVVLCFHRMTIHLSSRVIVKEISILLIFPRDQLFPHV